MFSLYNLCEIPNFNRSIEASEQSSVSYSRSKPKESPLRRNLLRRLPDPFQIYRALQKQAPFSCQQKKKPDTKLIVPGADFLWIEKKCTISTCDASPVRSFTNYFPKSVGRGGCHGKSCMLILSRKKLKMSGCERERKSCEAKNRVWFRSLPKLHFSKQRALGILKWLFIARKKVKTLLACHAHTNNVFTTCQFSTDYFKLE